MHDSSKIENKTHIQLIGYISLPSAPGLVKRERGRPAKDKDSKEKAHTPSAEGGKTKKHHGKK